MLISIIKIALIRMTYSVFQIKKKVKILLGRLVVFILQNLSKYLR